MNRSQLHGKGGHSGQRRGVMIQRQMKDLAVSIIEYLDETKG